MTPSSRPITHLAVSRLSGAAFVALLASALAPVSSGVMVTEPVGYIRTELAGGTPGSPGATFVSPSLVNPVEWQGKVTSVSGGTIRVSPADWEAGRFDTRYMLEIVTGPNAGLWAAVETAVGNELTVQDALASALNHGETVRIRRFTTLSDFLGAGNEAGLTEGAALIHADMVTVYHAARPRNYWYYDGSYGSLPGWYDSSWRPAADVIIGPGEGVIVQRKTKEPLELFQSGGVRTGAQSMIVDTGRNMVGGVVPVDLSLADSQLYTGDATTGVVSANGLINADGVVIYGSTTRTYWHYDGSFGGAAGWYDSSWRPADHVVIPSGATFVIERRTAAPFVWSLPVVTQ